MNTNKQNPDFVHIGEKILQWYQDYGRDLPFRKTKDPYKIWICEIVFQQTRIEQGLSHYEKFIEKFPNVQALANAKQDDVLLYWKGLGYYSRAINLHKAAQQIISEFDGGFPHQLQEVLKLKGVGNYTAAAICSICFDEKIPAVDGNFYRVLSRIFGDGFDVSSSRAFAHFTGLALKLMPEKKPGDFNQAMMDLGSEVCKPKNPACNICPVSNDCQAFLTGEISKFPMKTKKTVVKNMLMEYYFIHYKDQFLIQQRGEEFIWKRLFEFPTTLQEEFQEFKEESQTFNHKLTHRNLTIIIHRIQLNSKKQLLKIAGKNCEIVNSSESHLKSFPKPLHAFIANFEKEFRSKK